MVALALVEIGVRIYIVPFLCLPPMLLRGSLGLTAAVLCIALGRLPVFGISTARRAG